MNRRPSAGLRLSAREERLLNKYGLTQAAYDALLAGQGGVCAICGLKSREKRGGYLSVDHCHKTGRVRGILCALCNQMLGHWREDPAIFDRGAEYLRKAVMGA